METETPTTHPNTQHLLLIFRQTAGPGLVANRGEKSANRSEKDGVRNTRNSGDIVFHFRDASHADQSGGNVRALDTEGEGQGGGSRSESNPMPRGAALMIPRFRAVR